MFKVVTEDMKSLGLRRNPNIVTYPVGQILRHENPIEGDGDEGGYHVYQRLSGAKAMRKYMMLVHGKQTRIFSVEVENILFSNKRRAKVGAIRFVEEVLLCS